MRIISGKWGGRTWAFPKGLPVRPTTDRTRESLFNLLESRIDWEGLDVLELFTGSGAFSLECWSRGAARVVSVDQHPVVIAALKELVVKWGEPKAEIVKMPAERYIRQNTRSFDLVFLDPPYDWAHQEALVATIVEGQTLRPGGWLVVEHRTGRDFSQIIHFEEVRNYGSSALSLFFKPEIEAQN